MNCRACDRPLTNPERIKKGIGPHCERREQGILNGTIKPKITLIKQQIRNYGKPVPTRQYLWTLGRERTIITVFVDDVEQNKKSANCGCGSNGECKHILTVANYEKKFYPAQKTH